jgi:NlpC/P60 family putative phage cell wall peptidase
VRGNRLSYFRLLVDDFTISRFHDFTISPLHMPRPDIVHLARAWLGTPYHHQASCRGAGTDCIGLIRGVYRELYGREAQALPAYTRDWAEASGQETLLAAARRHLTEIAPSEATLVDMSQDEIGLAYIWRCGPANRDIGHPSYLETTHAFQGTGLRPLSPAHVRGLRSAGDLAISWVRRTRIGGDNWDAAEVPLGEESERYEVDILDGATVKRTLAATTPSLTYTAAQQTADFGAPQSAIAVRVSQLSAVHGRGTPRTATL